MLRSPQSAARGFAGSLASGDVKLLWSLQAADDPVIQFLGDLISRERVWDALLVLVGAIVAIGVDAYRSRKELFCEVIYDWPSVMHSFAFVSPNFGLAVAKRMYEFFSLAERGDNIVVVNVRNTGFETIEPGDFVASLECDFGEGADVRHAEVIGTRPDNANASARVEGSRRVLIEIDFLSRRDTVLVAVRRFSSYTDAQIKARIVGTNLRVARSPRRRRDIAAYRPTTKYWIMLVAPVLHFVVSPLLYSYSYTVLQLVVDYVTLVLLIAFFYPIYRDWRIRGRVIFP